ncbi:glycosyl transferase [Longispora fulva]|uniref:Glycosyltransferase involved in cell wall biosynthesis n=1 Tax=Longispora fulva TaxID=619741 RepID=A0A8J7GGA6_9ACTN|nr:glycosyltransferase [Longispora fulva]MBG6137351.1 glycosyltransferase involved in cell wall biosynthesis [Longispora fulva]GIG61295.1 glycosyl transferase [Longispora fulva]
MRIVIITTRDLRNPLAGSGERYTHEVARRWAAAGHEVRMFAQEVPGLPPEEDHDGVRVERAGTRRTAHREARRWYAETRPAPDLVLDALDPRPSGCPAWVTDAPVVALALRIRRPGGPVGRWRLRGYRTVPTLAVSASAGAALLAHGLTDVTVVPAGTGSDLLPAARRAPVPTVAYAGPHPREAVRAHQLLRARIRDAQLWVFDPGRHADRLAGPGVRVFAESDRAEGIARAHAQVLTAATGDWPLAVDEAAACGTPTIGYDRPGLRDAIPAARGVLTAPSAAALADGLLHHLPRWAAHPAAGGWAGGALGWDAVAEAVLAAATTGR